MKMDGEYFQNHLSYLTVKIYIAGIINFLFFGGITLFCMLVWSR